MLDAMRLQFDLATLINRTEDNQITITEEEYEGIAGKVIACKVDSTARTVTYSLEEFNEEVHLPQDEAEDVTEDDPELNFEDEAEPAVAPV
jgi:hypothetical protein